MSTTRRILALALCGAALLATPSAAHGTPIAPGVDYLVSGSHHVVVADVTQGAAVRVNMPKQGGSSVDFAKVVDHAQAAGAIAAINANYFDVAKGGACGAARSHSVQFSSHYEESPCRTSLGWGPGEATLFDSFGHAGDATLLPQLTEVVSGGGVLLHSGASPSWPQLTMPAGRAMTALGISADRKRFVLLVTDKGTSSASQMTQTLQANGAADAIFLDGGGSSRLWIQGQGYVNLAEGGDRLVPVVVLVLPAPVTPDSGPGPADAGTADSWLPPDSWLPADGGVADGASSPDLSPGGDGSSVMDSAPLPPDGGAGSSETGGLSGGCSVGSGVAAPAGPLLLGLLLGLWWLRRRARLLPLLVASLLLVGQGCEEGTLRQPPPAADHGAGDRGQLQDGVASLHDSAPPPPPEDAALTPQDSAPPAPDAAPPAADAAPPPPPPVTIAVLSDLNGSYGSTTYGSAVHAAVKRLNDVVHPDIVLITGDMVAGQKSGLDYQAMWTAFHAAVTTPLQQGGAVVAVTPGNHDASGYSSYAQERTIFVNQWKAASKVPKVTFVDDSNYPLHYSFRFKGLFFVSLDATTVGPLSSAQRSWVDAQLAQAKPTELKIVFGHLPIHPVTVGRETEILNDLKLQQILVQRKVGLFLSGHHHGYYPGAAGGVRQIAMGCVGSGPRALIGTSSATAQSLVLIKTQHGAPPQVQAYAATSYTKTIARSSLPTKLTYGSHTLNRDDLAGF